MKTREYLVEFKQKRGEITAHQWDQDYKSRKGRDRNDILKNSGVMFQRMALERSFVEALRTLPVDRKWKILEVGCGSGSTSLIQFLSAGFPAKRLYGIDLNPKGVIGGHELIPGINFMCGDGARMPYADDVFDLVLESTMFVQISDGDLRRRIAEEMLRVVKPAGYIALIDWRFNYGHPNYHSLTKRDLANLFQVGRRSIVLSSKQGALVPPLGRFLSAYLPSFYFIVQRCFPFLAAQRTVILQKSV